MEYTIGLLLSVGVIGTASVVGLGRDRSFYSTIMIVIASYYVLFAVMGGSGDTVILESLIAGGFLIASITGFRTNLWVVVAALVGHGLFDAVHHQFIENPGVPRWWPGFCLAFDVTAGGLLAFLLQTRHRFAVHARGSDWHADQWRRQRGTSIMKASAPHAAAPVSTQATPSRQARPELRTMKAMVHDQYGSFDALRLRDIDVPVVGDHDILIRVRAAGLNVGDCFGVKGSPLPMRLATGLLKPKCGVPGFDLAGQVEAVGNQVTQFKPGDDVFGASRGTCAEYVLAEAGNLALMPATLTFEQAAAMPIAALAALHALRDVGKVQPGQSVLINGASGGVGTFAVQIAKSFGAQVTGVCSTRNVDMVRSIGADHVIDYAREDFTEGGQQYDLIFDNVENRSLSDCRRALTPSGTLILNSGSGAQGIALLLRLVKPLVLSPFVRQTLRRYLSIPNHDDLVYLKELVESGKLRPVIDGTYPLRETPTALGHVERGHAQGKVVVTVCS